MRTNLLLYLIIYFFFIWNESIREKTRPFFSGKKFYLKQPTKSSIRKIRMTFLTIFKWPQHPYWRKDKTYLQLFEWIFGIVKDFPLFCFLSSKKYFPWQSPRPSRKSHKKNDKMKKPFFQLVFFWRDAKQLSKSWPDARFKGIYITHKFIPGSTDMGC